MKKVIVSNGVRVRSQVKAGVDYCKLCHLGCIHHSEEIKITICHALCDNGPYCNNGVPSHVGGLPSNG